MVETLGFRVSEQVIGDDGRLVGSWLHVTPKSYDLAYGRVDPAGVGGRLHHVAFAVDAREYVMRAADVFLDAGVTIECGPAKHAVQQTCFLYAFEPGGNRIEIITDGRLLLAPDWPPVTWTMEERKRGQAWGTLMPESWFTYATPPVESPDVTKQVPLADTSPRRRRRGWHRRTCRRSSTRPTRSSFCATHRSARTSIPSSPPSSRTGVASSAPGARRQSSTTRRTTWSTSSSGAPTR